MRQQGQSSVCVAIGGIVHETHSFAETRTTLADFEQQSFHVGDALLSAMRGTRSAIGGMIWRSPDLLIFVPVLETQRGSLSFTLSLWRK